MIVGQKTNRLTLVEITQPKIRSNGMKRPMALFRCECGNESIKDISAVKSSHTKQCNSCGRKCGNEKIKTHGLVKHKLYAKWRDMINRCYNENVSRYKNYGGNGIKVCDEWRKNFKVFYDWCIANGWDDKLTIDRVDVYGDYAPNNCRFITMKEQGFNKRNTYYVVHNGEKVSLSKLLHEKGMPNRYKGIWAGIKNGIPFEYYVVKYGL